MEKQVYCKPALKVREISCEESMMAPSVPLEKRIEGTSIHIQSTTDESSAKGFRLWSDNISDNK